MPEQFVVIGWRESDADCAHPVESSLYLVGIYDTKAAAEAAADNAGHWLGLSYYSAAVVAPERDSLSLKVTGSSVKDTRS